MARSKHIYTIEEVASMIGENLELITEVTNNTAGQSGELPGDNGVNC